LTSAERLYFPDNLRVALTILLISHHVGQAYGPTGGWWPIQEAARASVLGPFFAVNRSFFMSLFFMISGYFMVMSCAERGPRDFLKSRLLRLGIPLLVYASLMILLKAFGFITSPPGSSWLEIDVGYLWFIEHLLIFSVCYALWRIWKGPAATTRELADPPGYLSILIFAILLALTSAVVRIWYPIDRWSNVLGFVRVAFADVPRDLSFFIIGAFAYRRQWFLRFPAKEGWIWLTIALIAAGFWYTYILWLRPFLPAVERAMGIIYPLWEALLCCGMCIGLLVAFREKFDFHGSFARILARSQYAAYLFHGPIVVLLQKELTRVTLPPLSKFAFVTLASVLLTFLFSTWVRKPLRI
jgi:fucose 4-O-acetylase-like acetyltransferase